MPSGKKASIITYNGGDGACTVAMAVFCLCPAACYVRLMFDRRRPWSFA